MINDLVININTFNRIMELCGFKETRARNTIIVQVLNIVIKQGPLRLNQTYEHVEPTKPRSHIHGKLKRLVELGFLMKTPPLLPENWGDMTYLEQKKYLVTKYRIKTHTALERATIYSYEPSKIIRKLLESQHSITEFIDLLVPVEPYPFVVLTKEIEA